LKGELILLWRQTRQKRTPSIWFKGGDISGEIDPILTCAGVLVFLPFAARNMLPLAVTRPLRYELRFGITSLFSGRGGSPYRR
jgi:hypothetical protein